MASVSVQRGEADERTSMVAISFGDGASLDPICVPEFA
jgi:hypothetical protein